MRADYSLATRKPMPAPEAVLLIKGAVCFSLDNVYLTVEGIRRATAFLDTFVEYPPSQIPASFSIDQAVENLKMQLQKQQEKK